MKHLDLFSGIGGFALAAQWSGIETVAFCEKDDFCRSVLRKHWPGKPVYRDIKELSGEQLQSDGISADVLTGGFPCQPYSVAGDRRGKGDDRDLWPEMLRIIREMEPAWVVGENVRGIIGMELDQVLSDLEESDYSCESFVVPACAVDAPHRRDRLWIVGYTEDNGCDRGSEGVGREGTESQQDESQLEIWSQLSGPGSDVADTESERVQRHRAGGEQKPYTHEGQALSLCRGERPRETYWSAEPDVGRVANGIPRRVDRLKGLGNAIVPQIAMQIGLVIKAVHDNE